MNAQKNQQVISLQVTEGLTVAVLQNPNHEFLLPVKDVAKGYGVSSSIIRKHQGRHSDELIENKHYVKGWTISPTLLKGVQPHAVFWTKAGVIRLGFFIKSERAKLFRDWAENLVLQASAPKIAHLPPAEPRRNHNRLTQTRLLDIMIDVAKVEDKEVRLSLIKN